MKHFIALVKMGGEHAGKIGQHSTRQINKVAAIKWAKERFSTVAVIVDMSEYENGYSLPTDLADKLYKEGVNKR